ncbi:unnamed protein product [Linum trigynum]|uniref:Uncharacterized protein n=1 Tax=Linum trigynum TaxID=586398 RepID=A0AAV2FE04_9ROSI
MHCDQAVNLTIKIETLKVDLYELSFKWLDMVLDVQWLKQLKLVGVNWEHLTLHFMKRGRCVYLKSLGEEAKAVDATKLFKEPSSATAMKLVPPPSLPQKRLPITTSWGFLMKQ